MSKCNIERPAGVCPHRKWDGECASDKYCAHKIEPPKPKTNTDRIRSMTDEELAAVISQKEGIVQFCGNKVECLEMLCADAEIPDEWCMECAMEWLKQPCEEGKL